MPRRYRSSISGGDTGIDSDLLGRHQTSVLRLSIVWGTSTSFFPCRLVPEGQRLKIGSTQDTAILYAESTRVVLCPGLQCIQLKICSFHVP